MCKSIATLASFLFLIMPNLFGQVDKLVSSSEVYIFESAAKISGNTLIGFLKLNETKMELFYYRIGYDDQSILWIDKSERPTNNLKIDEVNSGTLKIEAIGLLGYSTEAFKTAEKLNQLTFYSLINENFLLMSNEAKMNYLDSLSEVLLEKPEVKD